MIDAAIEQDEEHRILIVDDDPDNLALLSGVLGNLYRVQVATSGQKALDLAAADPQPDLILLDVNMPDMNGHETCRLLKSEERTRGIPVIFVTGHDDEEDETHGFALGAADYITKPIRPALVRARLHTHLALLLRNRSLEALVAARTAQIAEANERLHQEKAEREQALQRIEHILAHDTLTTLPNRMRFLTTLDEAVALARRGDRELAVLSVAIDQFAEVNARFGQAVGDQVLQQAAVVVRGAAEANHLAARVAPTAFALVLQGIPGGADARVRAEQATQVLREQFAKPMPAGADQVSLKVEFGIALFPGSGESAAQLLQAADSSGSKARAPV